MTRVTILFYHCITAAVVSSLTPSHPFLSRSLAPCKAALRNDSTRLTMALTPVGPFCPFRSSTAMEEAAVLTALTKKRSTSGSSFGLSRPTASFARPVDSDNDLALEFNRLRAELSCGLSPDSYRMHSVADRVDDAVRTFEMVAATLHTSSDFATLEYVQLSQLHLEHLQRHDDASVEAMASMMRWQAACLRAMASSSSSYSTVELPPLPSNVNVKRMLQKMHQQNEIYNDDEDAVAESPLLSTPLVALAKAAQHITAPVFGGRSEAAFESPMVAHEYNTLCHDHMNLVEVGGQYSAFDPSSKLLYLDKMEAISGRWDVFFARLALLGALNPDYSDQCHTFLVTLGMTETEYRRLLHHSHQKMRLQAVKQAMFGQP